MLASRESYKRLASWPTRRSNLLFAKVAPPGSDPCTQITLNRLSARNVRTMVGEVAAQRALSEESIATLVERTSGVPLFVEELTRAVLESGNAKLSGHQIPATLQDSLMARLDRLGRAKEVVQIGSVIGSEFSYELLHAVHPIAQADLQTALRSLADADLLYLRGIVPDAAYQFKHALIRDAAYEALLKTRRKELHLTVARTIDEKFPVIKGSLRRVTAGIRFIRSKPQLLGAISLDLFAVLLAAPPSCCRSMRETSCA